MRRLPSLGGASDQGLTQDQHVVSRDGSRIFWASVTCAGAVSNQEGAVVMDRTMSSAVLMTALATTGCASKATHVTEAAHV